MDVIINILSWIFILTGSFFVVVGALGLIRMPDVYTRMHAGSVIDTAGAAFLIFGMMLQAGLTLITVKLLLILAIFFFTSPVVSHAFAQAALTAGIVPKLTNDRRPKDEKNAGNSKKSKENRRR